MDIGAGPSGPSQREFVGVGSRFKKLDTRLSYRYTGWEFGEIEALDSFNRSPVFVGVKFWFGL